MCNLNPFTHTCPASTNGHTIHFRRNSVIWGMKFDEVMQDFASSPGVMIIKDENIWKYIYLITYPFSNRFSYFPNNLDSFKRRHFKGQKTRITQSNQYCINHIISCNKMSQENSSYIYRFPFFRTHSYHLEGSAENRPCVMALPLRLFGCHVYILSQMQCHNLLFEIPIYKKCVICGYDNNRLKLVIN